MRLGWNGWINKRWKGRKWISMLKCKFPVYIQFMFVCVLGISYWIIWAFHLHTLTLMNLTCSINSHWSESRFSSMILPSYFSFLLTLHKNEWLMNMWWMWEKEKKKRNPYTNIVYPDSRSICSITKAAYYWRLHSHSIPFNSFCLLLCINTDGFFPVYLFLTSNPAYRCTVAVYKYKRRNSKKNGRQTSQRKQPSLKMRHFSADDCRTDEFILFLSKQPRNNKKT